MTVFPTMPPFPIAPTEDPSVAKEPCAASADVAESSPALQAQRVDTVWLWQGSRLIAQAANSGSRFVGETCGASALEYTVILALIIASLYLGVEFLARPAVESFARVADVNVGDRTDGPSFDRAPARGDSPEATSRRDWLSDQTLLNLLFVGFVFNLSVVLLAAMLWRHWATPAENKEEEADEETDARQHVFDKRQQIARTLSVHLHKLLEHGMTVGHVMSKLLSPVHVDTPRAEVERTMNELHVRHLLVVDSEGILCGIISDRDLNRRHGQTAGEMMTANPISTTTCSPLNPAITQLIQRRISCLPVIDEGKPIGVLTTTDVMMTLQCMLHEMHKLGEKERKSQVKTPVVSDKTQPSPALA